MVTGIKKERPVAWQPLGTPGVWHLFDTFVWHKGVKFDPKPLCDDRNHAVVYRPDGNIYCRFCIVMEGLL
jgi:hypothetical protein